MGKLISLAICAVSAITALASTALVKNERIFITPSISIGHPVPDFKLPDSTGVERTLSSLKGKHGTAIVFLSTECPVVADYVERIAKIAAEYKAKGVNFVGIYSNATESVEDMKAHAKGKNLNFAVLRDEGNKIADQFSAERTPEIYLVDANLKLVYHGRVDNNRNLTLVSSNDLRDAMDATIAAKPVAKPEAAAFGCTIKRAQ